MLSDYVYVRRFINDNCIARVPLGSKALPSYQGQGSGYYSWQFYLREALFNPKVLEIIVKDFMARYEAPIRDGLLQLCGVESASTPLLTGITIACRNAGIDVNVFSIRKEQKPYGRRNWIEGKALPNKLAMMVDDLTSPNHKTTTHGVSVLYNHAIPIVNHCYAVIFKTNTPENNKIKLLGRDTFVSSMFNLTHFDLELEDYEKNKQYYPWDQTSLDADTKNSSTSKGAL